MTQTEIDAITAAADYTLIIGGIASIFAIMAGVYVVVRGGRFILSALRGS